MLSVRFWRCLLLLLTVALLSCTSLSVADQVGLAWNANSEPDLAGYRLHWGMTSGVYTNTLDVGNVTTYTTEIADGSYIALTAYDNKVPSLESGYSNEVFYEVQAEIYPATDGHLYYEELNPMAVVLGTNSGFCSASPAADPAGGSLNTMDYRSIAIEHTSPATAVKVTEIGWWCDNATEAADYEVGIYADDDPNSEPGTLVGKSTGHAKGVGAGWKKVTGLNISISSSTKYWIAVQLDNTSTTTQTDREFSGGATVILTPQTALPDPDWGASALSNANITAIYAIWEAAAGGLSIPVAMHHYQHNLGR